MHRTFQSPLLPARYISPGFLIVSSGLPRDNPEASCETAGRLLAIKNKVKIRKNLILLDKNNDKIQPFFVFFFKTALLIKFIDFIWRNFNYGVSFQTVEALQKSLFQIRLLLRQRFCKVSWLNIP